MPSRILIADDSGVFRKAVRAYLTQRNFDVCGEAIDGNDVVKKATELQPALIILDIRMPQMNGVEVASVLKGRMPNVRIVLLTMYDEVMGYKSLMSAIGVDATIPKMNCFDSLARCVRGLLSSPTPRSARNEQNQQAQETGSRYCKHPIP
jgi:DNA-binding NarL/FixJ family response regulator